MLAQTAILEHKVHLLRSQIKEARLQRDSLQKELERAAEEKAGLASKLAESEKPKVGQRGPWSRSLLLLASKIELVLTVPGGCDSICCQSLYRFVAFNGSCVVGNPSRAGCNLVSTGLNG